MSEIELAECAKYPALRRASDRLGGFDLGVFPAPE